MLYKVDDMVTVRDDLICQHYDGVYFNNDMYRRWRGKELTITHVAETYYSVEENDWVWSDGMLERPAPFEALPDANFDLIFGG